MCKEDITREELMAILDYNPDTGIFRWKIHRNVNAIKGREAGSVRRDGYIQVCVNYKKLLAHRLAWFMTYNIWPKYQIDHVNGNRSDNRLCNLREATPSQNSQNVIVKHCSSTQLLGVSFDRRRNKYRVRMWHEGKRLWLGYYSTAEEAYEARLAAQNELWSFQSVPRSKSNG